MNIVGRYKQKVLEMEAELKKHHYLNRSGIRCCETCRNSEYGVDDGLLCMAMSDKKQSIVVSPLGICDLYKKV